MATNGSPLVPRPESPAGSPRSASISLQAAAAMNAGLQREPSRRSSSSSLSRAMASPQAGRRRSAILMNLQLNDPSVPAPGEMLQEHSVHHASSPQPLSGSPLTADPHHHRAPSLGELHQELEAEQEAHVNRLLQMIRQQQLELQRLQSAHHPHGSTENENATVSERPSPVVPQPIATQTAHQVPSLSGSYSRSPVFPHRGSLDMSRRSRTPSRGASPRLRATSISAESGDWVLGGRDESAFYQAETQMLVRENQMLRHRIRELEKQLSEASPASANPSEPSVPSNLTRSSTMAEEQNESASKGQ
ncbi:hypothetical protein PT974_00868 [Cladobotryum mycophilum]|uniref:FAD dependent oxidoreductase n=1 Tax=Cladobotryum mycophilum TaxID=491253 RepID=A0ABR0T230_9HYPO